MHLLVHAGGGSVIRVYTDHRKDGRRPAKREARKTYHRHKRERGIGENGERSGHARPGAARVINKFIRGKAAIANSK